MNYINIGPVSSESYW